jgi:L-alanine-DL-glutamate epimerase-like enolase superfamily enzyme
MAQVQPDSNEPPGVADRIEALECVECVVPLPRRLRVGAATVDHRTYALVRLRTAGGLDGVGVGYGRGLPVTRIVQTLAPLLIGADATTPEAVRQHLCDAYWAYADRGLFQVAVSVLDLALWDILGKRYGAPLADLLGRRRHAVPVCAIAGYTMEGDDGLTALQKDMADLLRHGVHSVKLTIGAGPPGWDATRLAAVREVVGDDCRIAVDAFRSFTSLGDALRRLRLLERYDLSYVEDPFPESLAPLVAELRRITGMPIALGETLNGHRAFRELIAAGCVDVVRCDATVIGGVREFMAAAALASAHGLQVSTHVHQDVHVHFAAALSNLYDGGMEYMTPDAGLDNVHQLLHRGLEVRDGYALVPARPGLGLDVDWTMVKEFARG